MPAYHAQICALCNKLLSELARKPTLVTPAGTLPVVTSSTQNREVTIIRGSGKDQVRSTFKYDAVFGSYATQSEIFGRVLAGEGSVIADVMKGFESTVFAYGQTGTGKTHTMEGNIKSPELMGVRSPTPCCPRWCVLGFVIVYR